MKRIVAVIFSIAAGLGLAYGTVSAQSFDLTDGLVCWWDFDGDLSDEHTAPGDCALTDQNTVQFGINLYFPFSSQAVFMEAANSEYMTADAGGAGDLMSTNGHSFTLASYVKLVNNTTQWIALRQDANQEYEIYWASSNVRVRIYDDNSATLVAHNLNCGTPPFETLLQVWLDDSGLIGIRCDATESIDATAIISPAYLASDETRFHHSPTNGDIYMDQAGFWNRALTSAERDYLYNSGDWREYTDLISVTAPTTPTLSGTVYTTTLPTGKTGTLNLSTSAGEGGIILAVAVLAVLQLTTLIVSLARDGAVKWQR